MMQILMDCEAPDLSADYTTSWPPIWPCSLRLYTSARSRSEARSVPLRRDVGSDAPGRHEVARPVSNIATQTQPEKSRTLRAILRYVLSEKRPHHPGPPNNSNQLAGGAYHR